MQKKKKKSSQNICLVVLLCNCGSFLDRDEVGAVEESLIPSIYFITLQI